MTTDGSPALPPARTRARREKRKRVEALAPELDGNTPESPTVAEGPSADPSAPFSAPTPTGAPFETELRTVDELLAMAAPYNPRRMSEPDLGALRRSLRFFGAVEPVVANRRTGHIVGGHQRLRAAQLEGWAHMPVHWVDLDLPSEKQLNVALNRIAGEWDDEKLAALLRDLQDGGADLSLTGFREDELAELLGAEDARERGEGSGPSQAPSLAERFGVPPFSVLDARQGYWTARKRHWTDLGLRSMDGRDPDLVFSTSSQPPSTYRAKNAFDEEQGRKTSWAEFAAAHPEALVHPGTSIFDPVLAELAYRWFSPPDGVVLDPFAGGSVRGVVAAACGRRYVGVDVSERQVAANREQWPQLAPKLGAGIVPPEWRCGDSREIGRLAGDVAADLVFSCPPYADLERYSDDPRDLSTLEYAEFRRAYAQIIAAAVSRLRPDRFACFVVGEVRDPDGHYRGFLQDTRAAFEAAGCHWYGDYVLVTSVGSLTMRAARMFSATRKLGKTHQNILVFVKGDGRAATEACGDVEIELPEPEPGAEQEGDAGLPDGALTADSVGA